MTRDSWREVLADTEITTGLQDIPKPMYYCLLLCLARKVQAFATAIVQKSGGFVPEALAEGGAVMRDNIKTSFSEP